MSDSEMTLPAGKTCADCYHVYKCTQLFGAKDTNTECDFHPVRFMQRPEIHYLNRGFTPCDLEGIPKDWPVGHRWSCDWEDVTCRCCLAARP